MTLTRDDVIAAIPDLADFVASQGFELHRSGGEFKLLCPFHDDHNPSMGFNPNKGNGAGLFKCFACGSDAMDIFSFFGALHGVERFPDQIKLVGELAGLVSQSTDTARKRVEVEQRESKKKVLKVEKMTPREVLAQYRELERAAVDPVEPIESLGLSVRAVELMGGFVAPAGRFKKLCLVVPQRNAEGMMTSLRFRDFETKRRWSCYEEEFVEGEWIKTKESTAGLMAHESYFDDEICIEEQIEVNIEGETDLAAAFTLMVREFGDDPVTWPARWAALPGVSACHDILLGCRHPRTVMLFMDPDRAGLGAVFDSRPMKRIELADGTYKMVPNLESGLRPGLITKYKENKRVRKVVAAFPEPADDGSKRDLRDLVRDGISWQDFRLLVLKTGTTDPRGVKMRRRLASGRTEAQEAATARD